MFLYSLTTVSFVAYPGLSAVVLLQTKEMAFFLVPRGLSIHCALLGAAWVSANVPRSPALSSRCCHLVPLFLVSLLNPNHALLWGRGALMSLGLNVSFAHLLLHWMNVYGSIFQLVAFVALNSISKPLLLIFATFDYMILKSF
jgi:hypothetical protein